MNRRGFLSSIGAGIATLALSTRLATAKLPEIAAPELSEASLEEMLIQIRTWTDERGIAACMQPSTLWFIKDQEVAEKLPRFYRRRSGFDDLVVNVDGVALHSARHP